MNKTTNEQAWTVLTECQVCGEEMEMSEIRYIEMGNICESCLWSGVEDIEQS